jgi:NADP-dependent 3-hydroxy acid dehydrogenase YdfG
MSVKGKVIIITGASSGIGAASAQLLAKNGAKVVLVARNESELQKVMDSINQNGGQAIYQRTM